MAISVIQIEGADGSPGRNAMAGGDGVLGANAVQGTSSGGKCQYQSASTRGGNGTDSGMAAAGSAGYVGSGGVFHLGDVSGEIVVTVSGGIGGNGGNGANGGKGGNGGVGSAASGSCGALPGSPGGNGGNGSNGANGGKGADAPNVVLYYTRMAPGTTFKMEGVPLAGGRGGTGGTGGAGGAGGSGAASGSTGSTGAAGSHGVSGRPGGLTLRPEPGQL